MKPDQWQFPAQPDIQPLQELESVDDGMTPEMIADVESAFVDVAFDPQSGEYESIKTQIKEIEAKIETLRASATEETLPRRTALEQALASLKNVLSSRSQLTLRERLVEEERDVTSRKLFVAKDGVLSQSLWYDQNDWLYEVTDDKGTMVALYKFEEDMSYKLVDGRSIAFAPGEEAALIETINRYFTLIQIELYSNKADWVTAA